MHKDDQDRKREFARFLLEKLRPLARKLEKSGHFPGVQMHGPQLFSYCCIERERLARITSDVPRIGIVLSGQKEFWLGIESQNFGAGDVFVLPADVAFDVVNIPSETSGLYETLLVDITEVPIALRGAAARNRKPRGLDMRVTLTPELVDALAHAAIQLNTSGHASALAAHRLSEVLMLLAHDSAAACLFSRPLADRIVWLVAARPAIAWTAERLGKALGIGASTLRRQLSRQGTSLRNVLAGARMQVAYQMLAEGSGIGEAAIAAGYSSRSHFALRFKQVYGRTPADTRLVKKQAA